MSIAAPSHSTRALSPCPTSMKWMAKEEPSGGGAVRRGGVRPQAVRTQTQKEKKETAGRAVCFPGRHQIVSTFSRLVVPERPLVMPPVMMISSPLRRSIRAWAAFLAV